MALHVLSCSWHQAGEASSHQGTLQALQALAASYPQGPGSPIFLSCPVTTPGTPLVLIVSIQPQNAAATNATAHAPLLVASGARSVEVSCLERDGRFSYLGTFKGKPLPASPTTPTANQPAIVAGHGSQSDIKEAQQLQPVLLPPPPPTSSTSQLPGPGCHLTSIPIPLAALAGAAGAAAAAAPTTTLQLKLLSLVDKQTCAVHQLSWGKTTHVMHVTEGVTNAGQQQLAAVPGQSVAAGSQLAEASQLEAGAAGSQPAAVEPSQPSQPQPVTQAEQLRQLLSQAMQQPGGQGRGGGAAMASLVTSMARAALAQATPHQPSEPNLVPRQVTPWTPATGPWAQQPPAAEVGPAPTMGVVQGSSAGVQGLGDVAGYVPLARLWEAHMAHMAKSDLLLVRVESMHACMEDMRKLLLHMDSRLGRLEAAVLPGPTTPF